MNCQIDDDIYVPAGATSRETVHRESLVSRVRHWLFESVAPRLRAMHLL
ncbi:MAG: hypothetical protein QM783_13430 [Phycisphaerales bacterium]